MNIVRSLRLALVSALALGQLATAEMNRNPQNIVVVWDLHGVLLQTNLLRIAKVIRDAKTNDVLDSLKKANLDFYWKVAKLLVRWLSKGITGKDGANGEEFVRVAHQLDPELAQTIVHIANCQDVMPGMDELLQDLSAAGYKNLIASNIGQTIFNDVTQKDHYPVLWEGVFQYLDLTAPHVVTFDPATQTSLDIIMKPDIRFYQEFLRKNNIDPTKTQVIFVDDTRKNVDGARRAGFTGIHFRDAISLREELRKLGVNIGSGARTVNSCMMKTDSVSVNVCC